MGRQATVLLLEPMSGQTTEKFRLNIAYLRLRLFSGIALIVGIVRHVFSLELMA